MTTAAPSHRQHGTRTKYVQDGCRCFPCRLANADYARALARRHAYGQQPLVDSQPVREYIRALTMAGVGTRRIAALSGVGRSTLRHIVVGRGELRPADKVRRDTAEAILAVEPDRAEGCAVDGTGTRRRLRALVAAGWSQQRIAEAIGWTPSNFTKLINDDVALVTPRTAGAAREVYDRLWNEAPPCGSSQQRGGVNRARRHAAAQGWQPPMAWDDDEIDDPEARPHTGDSTAAGRDDEAEFLLGQGVALHEVASRLGVKPASLERARHRRAQASDQGAA